MRRGTRGLLPTIVGFLVVAVGVPAGSPPPAVAESHTVEECEQTYTPIYNIQGSGSSAAISGNVTTQGVIVGDFEGAAGLSGFYLQDPTGDGDSDTSDGVFVYTGTADAVTEGQLVRVSGYARERFGETTINGSNSNNSAVSAANIVDCEGTGSVSPTDVTLPVSSLDDFEAFEGMLVRFPQELVISEYFNYDRFGEIVLGRPLPGESRFFTPTLVEEPGPDATARASAYALRRITLDDGLSISNPNVTRHPNGDPFSLSNRFRGGDTVSDTVGVLGFGFGRYRIQPTQPAAYTALNERPATPDNVGGRLKVAAFNMLNFFLTPDAIQEGSRDPDDPADNVCGGLADLECRGHDGNQPAEFDRQRDKLLAALSAIDADVVGVNEIENTPGVEPLGDPTQGIVAGLNAMPGGDTYAHIDTGVIGTDAIRVGLIYKPTAVTPVGDFALLTSAVDPRFNDDKSRPALAQTFEENSTGERFTVVVNHLKSKGSPCGAGDDDPTLGGQGNCNLTRTLAAQALVDWLATDPTASGDPDFLITGDLNAYAKEDPIDAVRAGADGVAGTADDYTNLIARYQGAFSYSFVFDGQAGYLDHALSSASLTGQVTGATEWHINADEPDILDYDTSFKSDGQDAIYAPDAYRSSDHDPVIVGLDLLPNLGKVTGMGSFADGSFDLAAVFQDNGAVGGQTSLSLSGGLSLTSTDYDWLVVDGSRATYVGTGNLNGDPGASFLVSVDDGGKPKASSDVIRLKVWEADGDVAYDSQPGDGLWAAPTSVVTGGNIVVHRAK